MLAAAARYRDQTDEGDASARAAAVETAVFERFARKVPLVQIVAELGVPVAYVRELWKVYTCGLPYEHPERSDKSMPDSRSLSEHHAEVKRLEDEQEKSIAEAEREIKRRQEKREKEHRALLASQLAVLEGREPPKGRASSS